MRKSTGKTTEHLHDMSAAVADEVGSRVSYWLREAYPSDTAKVVARLFGCSPRTVEGWLAGHMPANRHLLLMMRAWGRQFVAFIFEPAVGTSLAAYAIDQELQELKVRMAAFEGALNAASEDQLRTLEVSAGGAAHEAQRGPR